MTGRVKKEEEDKGERKRDRQLSSGSRQDMVSNLGTQSSVAVCPVRRRCPRFRAPGYTIWCSAGHDRGPCGYPVLEVGPMAPSSKLY